MVEKAECLVHFSYEKSDHKLMLLDVQGSGYILYDPEIATASNAIDENNLKFMLGNLAFNACWNFINVHSCNKYCKMLQLKKLLK